MRKRYMDALLRATVRLDVRGRVHNVYRFASQPVGRLRSLIVLPVVGDILHIAGGPELLHGRAVEANHVPRYSPPKLVDNVPGEGPLICVVSIAENNNRFLHGAWVRADQEPFVILAMLAASPATRAKDWAFIAAKVSVRSGSAGRQPSNRPPKCTRLQKGSLTPYPICHRITRQSHSTAAGLAGPTRPVSLQPDALRAAALLVLLA